MMLNSGLRSLYRCLPLLLLLLSLPAGQAFAYQAQTSTVCRPGYVAEHLVGGLSMVTPGLPNRIRSAPSIYDTVGVPIGTIPGGGVVTVIEGPVCADGYGWWKINYEGTIGWTADGEGSIRWMERIVASFGTYEASGCPVNLPGRLITGQPARVTPGLPNALRDKPGKTTSNSRVISEIPAGMVFDVIGGPFCADGYRWWAIIFDSGLVGWTAEGEGSTYWLELAVPTNNPTGANCPATIFAPLQIGRIAYINNTLAINVYLYARPDDTLTRFYLTLDRSTRLTVIAGPVCDDGARWWEVEDSISGIVGWVMEGNGTQSWLVNSPTEFAAYEYSGGCPANLPARLTVGLEARVTPGDPNTLRDNPGTHNAATITQIPGGSRISVLGGPFCVENRRYWAVSYQGIVGWTAEGEGLEYWLAP